MESPRRITQDVSILPSSMPIPGLGILPVNAFVIAGEEPVLVDTGLHQDRGAFQDALGSVIDPADLRWIWLTHPDQDHVGSLRDILEAAPQARLITTFLGFGILSLFMELSPTRLYLLNPGEALDIGDRTLHCIKPPIFDNPATTAFYDDRTGALFSSDCFGALLQAPAEEAAAITLEERREGQLRWATIDAPWLHKVESSRLAADLDEIRALRPEYVLSAHLPPAHGMTDELITTAARATSAPPFVGPNQAALEAMLRGAPIGAH
jgi:glyoxylase-like metal-dependent hydrolase (beta-lactamase superfamily II)